MKEIERERLARMAGTGLNASPNGQMPTPSSPASHLKEPKLPTLLLPFLWRNHRSAFHDIEETEGEEGGIVPFRLVGGPSPFDW